MKCSDEKYRVHQIPSKEVQPFTNARRGPLWFTIVVTTSLDNKDLGKKLPFILVLLTILMTAHSAAF